MTNAPSPGTMRIGDALLAARARAEIDLAAAEEGTKIRGKYLRALEQERWEELPSRSHAKGFLRTYGDFVGLDGELLVDEYRRQVEQGAEGASGAFAEGILERRRPGAFHERRRWPFLVAAALVVVAILAALGLTAGDDETDSARPAGPEARERAGRTGAGRQPDDVSAAKGRRVELALAVLAPVEICLLDENREELIDGQVVNPGERDLFTSKRFSLRFPSGFERADVRLRLNGERVELPRSGGPRAFSIAPPARLRETGAPGKGCP